MTLLEDLRSLDLSAVLDAKVTISATVDGEDIAALVDSGAVHAVLGELGEAVEAAVGTLDDPDAIVGTVTTALTSVLQDLGGDLPLGEYLEAVGTAARVVADLLPALSRDPADLPLGATDLGGLLRSAGAPLGDHAAALTGTVARLRGVVELVERGLPTDPAALVVPTLEILLPFPVAEIRAAAAWATQLGGRLDRVVVDPRIVRGLVTVLGEVRVAADAGDAAALEQSLRRLEDVRANTVSQLAAALRAVASTVAGLRVGEGAAAVRAARAVLSEADDTALDVLESWRARIAEVRGGVARFDPTEAAVFLTELVDRLETQAREILVAAIDESVEAGKQWLRGLLREIPLRPLRVHLSEAIADAARAVADADLDAPVEAVRGALRTVATIIEDSDPSALVAAAVETVENVVRDALDRIEESLGTITEAIEDLADQAAEILQRAVDGLRDFRGVVDEITATVDDLGIADAARDIAAALAELREQITEILSAAPVPEALRAGIEQLISVLESIDLDSAVGRPLRELAARIQLPPALADTVREGLEAVAETVTSLVPDDVVADLQGLLDDVLAEIRQLDPTELTQGITDALEDAAGALESVRFTELLAPAQTVFDDIVSAVDRVHPRLLLRPAIDLYRQVLGAVPVPSPDTFATRVATVQSAAAEGIARAAAEPARRVVGAGEPDPAGMAPETPPADLRPGDVVRLVGFLPGKLREAVAALDDGAAGEFLDAVDDALSAGALALRDVRDRVAGLEAVVGSALDAALAPVTAAQVDAQLALQGSAAFSAGGLDVDASFAVVASVGPVALESAVDGERQLAADRCRAAAAGLGGALAADLDEVADLLESLLPSGVLADIDAFLAALDPEPVAAELDALFTEILDAVPDFLTGAADVITALAGRVRGLVETFGPGALAQRYLGVLDVVREELALLDPARLADELGEVHAEIRAALTAYDPRGVAGDLDALLASAATAVRGLSPAGLVPDLSGLADQVARVTDLLPVNAIAGVGTQLDAVGAELRALDVQGMLDAVNSLGPELAEGITFLVDAVRDELVNLLRSIRFAAGSVSVTVTVEVG